MNIFSSRIIDVIIERWKLLWNFFFCFFFCSRCNGTERCTKEEEFLQELLETLASLFSGESIAQVRTGEQPAISSCHGDQRSATNA